MQEMLTSRWRILYWQWDRTLTRTEARTRIRTRARMRTQTRIRVHVQIWSEERRFERACAFEHPPKSSPLVDADLRVGCKSVISRTARPANAGRSSYSVVTGYFVESAATLARAWGLLSAGCTRLSWWRDGVRASGT